MAHQLENDSSMIYCGETPWHRLGIDVGDAQAWADVARLLPQFGADMDLSPLVATLPNGLTQPVDGKHTVVRDYDSRVVGVVGDGYTVLQPRDMGEIADSILGQGGAHYTTAGSLKGGAVLWLQATLPGEIRVRGDESPIIKHLLLSNSFDGTRAFTMQETGTRVVCMNTLQLATRSAATDGFVIKHTRNASDRLALAANAMKHAYSFFAAFEEEANALAAATFSDESMNTLARTLMPAADEEDVPTRTANNRSKLVELFSTGTGITAGIRGTAWAAYNAVSEYADHIRGTRVSDGGNADEARLQSVWLGSAAAFKRQAVAAIHAQLAA